MQILDLENGSVSLEFSDAEQRSLLKRLSAFGRLRRVERGAFYDILRVRGHDLIHYWEWEPCLIATTSAGASLLRQLHDDSGGALAA